MASLTGQIGAWLFLLSLAICVYVYVGYPAVLWVMIRLFNRRWKSGNILPTVSLLIPAYNEVLVIRAKIKNSLMQNYPADKLQIRVISDGSDDGTDEIIREYKSSGIEMQRIEPRGGKPNAVNMAVPYAYGDILVLSDANTMLAGDAIRKIVRGFADENVGAVTGDVRLRSSDITYGHGEKLFYRLERFMQTAEAQLGSCIGVDGGMYALRRELYVPNRPDTLIDDFVIAMNVARAGKRVVYDRGAQAFEDSVQDPAQEMKRRMRTIAGGFQTLFGGRGRPAWHQLGLWLGYLSHKVLRWLGPLFLITMLTGNIMGFFVGRDHWLYIPLIVALTGQVVFYVLAFIGCCASTNRIPPILCIPYYFCLANAAAAGGGWKWFHQSQSVTWQKADRTLPTGQG